MARPWSKLPPGARDYLIEVAPHGLRESTAAKVLGMKLADFRRVISDNKEAKALWDEAMAIERDALMDKLYNRAMEGDAKAAQYLLAARHGMSEKAPEAPGRGVSLIFQLPAAMDAEKYLQALAPQALPSTAEASP